MRVLLSIAAGSASLLFLALIRPGLHDWVMLAGPCLAASIFLIFRHYFLGPEAENGAEPWGRLQKPVDNTVLVDGSNVMHWNENQPSLDTLRWVLEALRQRGFNPGVIFDANAGYKVAGRYLDDDILARELCLPAAQVLVVPKGTPADEYILTVARKLRARVVTNDRFRDWAGQFPEVHQPDFLIRGGARPGHVWLDETARPKGGA
jgi:hypothetical protein